MMKYILLLLSLTMIVSSLTGGVIKGYEYTLIDSLLERADLETSAPDFMKDWSLSTEFKITRIVEIINRPLEFPRFVDSIRTVTEKGDISLLADFLAVNIFTYDDYSLSANPAEGETEDFFNDFFRQNVKREKDLFAYAELVFSTTEEYRSQAFAELTAEDKEMLTWLSYTMWSDTGDKDRYESLLTDFKGEEFADLELKEIKRVLDRIDWGSLVTANRVFNRGVMALWNNLAALEFTNKKPLIQNTRWGRFIIGTKSDDIYRDNFSFLIEPGGDDIYYADLATSFNHPYYLVLDMSGNDLWRNSTPGALNRVLGGIGWLLDLDGDDQYYGDDLAFSSFLAFQYHYDGGGDDIYRSGRYSLGAATFGLSININEKGNDIYYSTGYSHGFGGTLGAGLLLDRSGDDLYYAGGKYRHAPLRPEDYRSMAQGFGFGVRPDWGGGIGILYDMGGNDSYEGGVYAQGVGYWYALGILLDGGGYDTFNAVQYAQGSGIHLAGGFLYNEAGDDTYYSRFGPGQGAGHDYAVGFLIDREGDDHYSIDGGNGLGLTNSVGIFLDAAGNDRYERNKQTNYGYANEARESGGIGIFMDLGGDDLYPDPGWSNNEFWVRGLYGIGFDTELVPEQEEIVEEDPVSEDLSFIDSLEDVDELFLIAAEWEVGSSIERVRKARTKILDFEEEAARHILENKLDTKRGLEYRAILDFAKNSEHFRSKLSQGLAAEDSLAVKNAISLAGDLKLDEYLDTLAGFIQDKKYLPATISALGNFSNDKAVALIIRFLDSPSEHLRFITARSLKSIDSELSRTYLLKMADDDSFLVRTTVKLAFPSFQE
jgi:hypothetical protein